MKTILAGSISVILLAFATATALAHGDAAHKPRPATDVVAAETSFGRTGDPKRVTRTVSIDMSDKMRFTPAELDVKQGDTVRFVVKNSGKVMHEMVLGSMKELAEHAELMKRYPNMEHEEDYMVHVAPGKTGEIVWQFTKAGEFHFGCLVPGHFEAGMVGRVRVLSK